MATISKSIGVAAVGLVTDSSGVDRPVVNSFVYYTTNATLGPFILRFMGAWEEQVWAPIAALLHEDYVGQDYQIYFPARFDPDNAVAGSTGPNGEATGDRLPLSLCVNVGLLTEKRSRNFLGLKRFGPIAESDTDKDELSATAYTAWSAAVAALSADVPDGFGVTWHPLVESRKLTAAHPTLTQVIAEPITSVRLNKTLGFARHRRERTNR